MDSIKMFAVWRSNDNQYWDHVWSCWADLSPNCLLTDETVARGIGRAIDGLVKFFDLTETRITNPKYFLSKLDKMATPGYNISVGQGKVDEVKENKMKDGLLDLVQGDLVEWDNGDSLGRGKVCGIAQNAVPGLGRNIILRIENSNVNTIVYPFSHCTQFELFLTKL
jgi:hypothetical protein